jgi:hypothetical protein
MWFGLKLSPDHEHMGGHVRGQARSLLLEFSHTLFSLWA